MAQLLETRMYIEPRSLISQRRSLIVRIGTAPDGLPRALSINRGTPPERLLTPVAHAVGVTTSPEDWTGSLRSLAEQVRVLVDARQFVKLEDGEGQESTYYLSWSNVKTLFGRTLFEELLRQGTPSVPNAPEWSAPDDPDTFMDTRAMVMGEVREEAMIRKERSSGLKLALDLNSEKVAVAAIEHFSDKENTSLRRLFMEESLQPLSTARFCARSSAGSVVEGSLGTEYAETRRQLGSQQVQWFLTAEKRELLQLCSKLARTLGEYHSTGYVHCDLKPANLLMLQDGLTPIDSLGVAVGERSPGLSQDYAAPEQIIGEPVQLQTDQYAFGIVLAKITGGLLYGEEARFHIPVSRSRLEVFKLLKNPGVFLAPQTLNASREALAALKGVIERCLSFDPQQRFISMMQLADELDKVLEKYEFSGFIESELRYGSLSQSEDLGLCWLIEDVHP